MTQGVDKDFFTEFEGRAAQTKEQEVIESSYFFGQFMAYHLVLKLIEKLGVEQTIKFMEKKRSDIAMGDPSFMIQADKITENAVQYFRDSMNEEHAFLKGKNGVA